MMLPTFGKLIRQRERANARAIRAFVRSQEPFLAEIPAHIIHEGRENAIQRSTGEIDETDVKTHRSEIEIDKLAIAEFNETYLESKLQELARQFAESASKAIFDEISRGAEAVGNVVDARGRPFDQELLLEVLGTMSHSFDEKGNWEAPMMVVGPDLMKKIQATYESSTPQERAEYDRKLRSIMEQKKAEYDSEQAGRVLAG